MASLVLFDRRKHRMIGGAKQVSVRSAKLFYVLRGRNAWHSTWVTHYREDSISPDLISAKSVAERWRQQGSVFTIRELPCIVAQGDVGSLAITQINTSTPMSGLLLPRRKGSEPWNWPVETLLERAVGRDLKTFHEALEEVYLSWHRFKGRLDDLLVFAVPTGVEIEVLGKRGSRLRKWRSRSEGGDYGLRWWQEWSSDLSGAVARNSAEVLDGLLKQRVS